MGFLRRNSNGTIEMNYLDKNVQNQQEKEKSVTIGIKYLKYFNIKKYIILK